MFTQRLFTKTWPRLTVTFIVLLALAGGVMTAALSLDGQPTVHAQDDQGSISGLVLSSPDPGQMVIAWNPPNQTPTDYRVRWAPSEEDYLSFSEANTAQRGSAYPTGTSHTVNNLPAGTSYKVQARARYNGGEHADNPWSGPWSSQVTVTISSPPPPPTTTPEPTPAPEPVPEPEPAPEPASDEVTNLDLSSDTAGQLTITWTQPTEAPTDYRISWTPAGEEYLSYSKENTSRRGNSYPDGSATTLTLTGLPGGVNYKVMMRTRYEDSSGPWTDEATQRIQSSPPAAPTGLTASEVSDSSVSLSWTTPSGEITGYRVLRGLTAAKQDVLENNTGRTETGYMDSDVEAETRYHYSVRAINDAGVGPASETIGVTTGDQAVNPRQDPANRPPKFPDNDGTTGADPVTVTISEHTAPGTIILAHATVDPDNDILTYSVSGADAAAFAEAFTQHTGLGYIAVKTGTNLDYETKASYSIEVNVTDSKTPTGDDENPATTDDRFDVTIIVTDVDETGTVSFTPTEPELGIPITAEITDTDGDATSDTWQWSKSDTADGAFTDIASATSATYRPAEADLGKFLKASVAYTDPLDSGKSASAVNSSAVQVRNTILIDNVDDSEIGSGYPGLSQGFTTGGHPEGYKISSVTISTTSSQSSLVVKIFSSTSNANHINSAAASELYELTYRSKSGSYHQTWDLPTGTRLDPNTVYHVVLLPANGRSRISCLGPGSAANSGAADWSLISTIRSTTATGGHQSTTISGTCSLRIRGEAAKNVPYITEISYFTEPNRPPTYDTGEIIKVAATFNETITPDTNNYPAIPLQIGSNTRNANYAPGGDANKVEFHYTVVAADQDNDGITIGQNSMTGSVLQIGGTGVVADLDHAEDNNNPDRRVNAAPTVTKVELTSSPVVPNWYTTGETIEITVTFSIPITVAGDPVFRFALSIPGMTSNEDRSATYTASASEPNTMVFRYTVLATDEDTNGIWLGELDRTFLLDADDSIKDGIRTTDNKDAVLTHQKLATQGGHRVSPLPRVVSIEVTSDPPEGTDSDTYGNRQLIEVAVTFNNDITVTGNPQFQIQVGTNDRLATYYHSLSTTKTMVFQYRVRAADMDDNGIWIGTETDTFQLRTEDSIKDSADRDAVLEHNAPGTLSGHKVNGSLMPPASAPKFPDVNPPDGADPITLTVNENHLVGPLIERIEANDPDGDNLTYSVGGTDAADFLQVFALVNTPGAALLRVKPGATVDYESKASYSITISVTDGENASGEPETPATIDDTVVLTINVTDLEEDGVITLSRATPSVGAAITATLTDPDGAVTSLTWQWAKSDTETGSFTDISGATSDSYTPVTADVGKWLKVTASYTDRRGTGKNAEQTATNAVDDTPHKVPSFATETITLTVEENADSDTLVGAASASDEDGDTLHYSLPGTDDDHDDFVATFRLNTLTGVITLTLRPPDYETKASYSVTVQVSDGENLLGIAETDATIDDTITVTINVTDLDESGVINLPSNAPVTGTPFTAVLNDYDGGVTAVTWQWAKSLTKRGRFTSISGATDASYTPVDADLSHYLRATAQYTDGHGPGKSHEKTSNDAVIDSPHKVPQFGTETRVISVDENSPGGTLVKNIRIFDPDGDELRYSLGGTDASAFNQIFHLGTSTATIQVKLGATPDYESRSSYSITVNVTDREDANGNTEVTPTIDDSIDITININNLEEPGAVTLSTNTPLVGSEYRASLTDPDGGITNLTWQWSKSTSRTSNFTNIAGAASSSYTPVDADENQHLRATASYDDGHGTGKSAFRVSDRQASTSPYNPPAFAVDSIEFNLAENTAGRVTVGTVVATDADGDTVYYVLGGPDAAAFTSETSLSQPGASIILQVFTAVDYETKQSYSLILSVTDREDEDGNPQTNHTVDDTVQITVNVLNVEEPGRLVINPVSLEQGINATASLTDPDGSLSNINWQWSRSDSGTGPFSDITEENGPNYVPVLPDKNKFLRIRVRYDDGYSTGNSHELITYVYAGTTTTEPNPVDFPKNGHTMGALRVGETSTGRLDPVDDNVNAPEHDTRIPRGDMFRIEGLTAGNSYRVRAWFGESKADSATPDRGGDIHLYGGRGDPGSIYSLGKYYDDLLEDGLATFAFPAHANEDYYLSVIAPAFRYDSPAVPAHDYYGPYMLEIYDLGPTQTPSQPEGYGIKATNVCVNNRCFNDPRFPEFHVAGHETNETHEVSVGNNPTSKNLTQAVGFRAGSSESATASFKLDRIGAFVHSMTTGSIAKAAIHASASSGVGAKLFDLEPLLNDEEHVDYFVAPQDAQALSRNTRYIVVFTEGGGSAESYRLYATAKTTEDDQAHSRWPMDDGALTRDEDAASPSWDETRTDSDAVLPQIRVYAGVAP